MILQKLQQAREVIKASKLKKAGRNAFSNYDYFTPEQVNSLVNEAEKASGLIHIFSMPRNEYGIFGELDIVEIETNEKVTFIQATEIPTIKATNTAQQIGGAVTYTLRYMLMTAFDISDNSLDFDAHDNREKPQQKKAAMPPERFAKLVTSIKASPDKAAEWMKKAREQFAFSDEQEQILADWESSL